MIRDFFVEKLVRTLRRKGGGDRKPVRIIFLTHRTMADIDNFYDDKLVSNDVDNDLESQVQEFRDTVGDTEDTNRKEEKTEPKKEKKTAPCGCRR